VLMDARKAAGTYKWQVDLQGIPNHNIYGRGAFYQVHRIRDILPTCAVPIWINLIPNYSLYNTFSRKEFGFGAIANRGRNKAFCFLSPRESREKKASCKFVNLQGKGGKNDVMDLSIISFFFLMSWIYPHQHQVQQYSKNVNNLSPFCKRSIVL